MMQINLLPWREQLRTEKKIHLLVLSLGFLGLTLFTLLIFHFYHTSLVKKERELTDYLQLQINQEQTLLNNLNAKRGQIKTLQDKINFITHIYAQNYKAVRLLNELVRFIPSYISIEKVSRQGDKVIFAGTANSDAEVTRFIDALKKSLFFVNPDLTSISTAKDASKKYFELEVMQKG